MSTFFKNNLLPDGFKDSFIFFLQSQNIPFCIKGEGLFLFKEYKFQIQLVFLKYFCPENIMEVAKAEDTDFDTLYLYEDRWMCHQEQFKQRILARVGRFDSIFARKCKVLTNAQISKDQQLHAKIKAFLGQYHTYGNAKCKYKYALEYNNQVVAVATFSESRPMPRNEIIFDSYEWVRYASLPNCRVVGGMGRLLKAFLRDLKNSDIKLTDPNEESVKHSACCKNPIEIMSYSDTEWSQGKVYESLGFKMHQERKPVNFYVNRTTGERISETKASRQQSLLSGQYIKIHNCGSKKYLLQIM